MSITFHIKAKVESGKIIYYSFKSKSSQMEDWSWQIANNVKQALP